MKFLNENLLEIEVEEKYHEAILNVAKKYFIHVSIESESTDFNDNYSDTYYKNYFIEPENIVVKNNEFYGVKVTATGDYSEKRTDILKLSDGALSINMGSEYARVCSTFRFLKLDTIKIVNLKEKPDLIDKACDRFSDFWGIPKEAYVESMNEMMSSDTYPLWLVALLNDKYIIGGLGVIQNDFHSRDDLYPNVCAVFVSSVYRGIFISKMLMEKIIELMHERGVDTLYLVTNHTGYYEKMGYEYYCQTMCDDGESKVYVHHYTKQN